MNEDWEIIAKSIIHNRTEGMTLRINAMTTEEKLAYAKQIIEHPRPIEELDLIQVVEELILFRIMYTGQVVNEQIGEFCTTLEKAENIVDGVVTLAGHGRYELIVQKIGKKSQQQLRMEATASARRWKALAKRYRNGTV